MTQAAACLLVISPFLSHAVKTQISDTDMTNLLANDRLTLAKTNAPVWFFGQEGTGTPTPHPPSIPVWSYAGVNAATGPDVYQFDQRTPPADRCNWPDVGCGCRNPPSKIHQATGSWPIYFTVVDCKLNPPRDIRVVYNVFYQKDGLSSSLYGHDW